MGKSPGKWMKTLLFGKKKSRSKNHKPVDNEETQVQKVPLPVSLDQRTEAKTEENQLPDNPQDEACMTTELNAQTDSDRIREEQAAIHLQAAFRGYAARRTLRSLIGIIRLQALIRGHLVRRQAVSTLHCMFQIVKFQALVRGRKIRNSSIGIQVGTRFNPVNRLVMCSVGFSTSMQILKQSSNGFARKLHSSSSTSMHLHFHYNSHEPNSVSSWLARWSASRCWQRLPNPKPDQPSEPLNPHTPRSSATNAEKISSKFDKPIKNLKKVSSTEPVNCAEESPELVLQRVKSNLRKVNNPVIQSRNDSVQKIITKPEKLSDKEDGNGAVSDTVKQVFMERKEAVQIKRRSVPGYMAATVSAKAKVRGQDGSEKYLDDALNRRHSMSSLSSASVSVSSMVKSAGKLKNDRSLQLSRDGNGNT